MQLYASIFLTIFFLIIEFFFFIKLNSCYRNITRSKISKDDFRIILENDYVSTHSWVNKIKWSLRRQRDIAEISKMINDYLSDGLDKINFFTNLGPAIGLSSTFAGMFSILIFLKKNMQPQDIPPMLSNIAPICLGSLAGILVYIYGNLLKRKISEYCYKKTEEYLGVCIEAEKNIFNFDPKEREEWANVIQKILTPLSLLVKNLNDINDNFNVFNKRLCDFDTTQIRNLEAYNKSVEILEKNTSIYIEILRSSFADFKDNIQQLLNNINELNTTTYKYNINLLNVDKSLEELLGRWNIIVSSIYKLVESFGSIAKMDANLESTSKNLQTTADKIENQIKKDLSEIISEMKRYTEAVNGYNEGLSKIKEPIQELVQKLPATQDILSIVDSNKNIISGIENVQKLIQEPNNPFTVTILEISNTLSKINGRLSTINISDNNLSPFEGPQLNKITNLVSTMIEMNKSLNDISANLERLGLYIERRANRAIVHKIQAFIAKVLDAIVNIIHIIKLKIRWLKIKKNH